MMSTKHHMSMGRVDIIPIKC